MWPCDRRGAVIVEIDATMRVKVQGGVQGVIGLDGEGLMSG